jgi:hypothetical protein
MDGSLALNQDDHCGIALLLGEARGGVAGEVLQCRVGTVIYQQLHNLGATELGCHHQRGLACLIGGVHVAALSQKARRHPRIALERDPIKLELPLGATAHGPAPWRIRMSTAASLLL